MIYIYNICGEQNNTQRRWFVMIPPIAIGCECDKWQQNEIGSYLESLYVMVFFFLVLTIMNLCIQWYMYMYPLPDKNY